MAKKLAIFVTHPIQYYAPMWRLLAAKPGVDVVVHFFSDHSVRGGLDADFGVNVTWDVPILDGYEHRFISRDADLSQPGRVGIPDVTQLLVDGKFDAVMVHGYTHLFERQAVRAARKLGLRTIIRGEFSDVIPYEGRSWLKAMVRGIYLRWFYRHIDAFCYIGEEAKDHLKRRGIPDSRLYFAPYSVDTKLFQLQRANFPRETSRQELGIEPGQIVVLFSGKLIPRKAPLLLLEAIGRLPNRDKLTLIVMGDGTLRQEIEKVGRPLLGPRLLMPGFVNQSQIGKYFMASDVFVLPSEFETWGLVVNEAMEFGLPVIASSRVGCSRDLVIEGKTGFIFPAYDAPGLSEKLEKFLADPSLAPRLGPAAEAHVAKYSTEASADGVWRALLGN